MEKHIENLMNERLTLVRDAVAMDKPTARIPQNSFFVTWKILDSGYKLSEAMFDYEIMEKVVREHQELYNWDMKFETGGRNALRVSAPMGGGYYTIDDDKEVVAYKDIALVKDDELDEFKTNPPKFYWEKAMKVKYPNTWNENTALETMQKVWDEQMAFGAYLNKMELILKEEYGLPDTQAPVGGCYPAPDFMFNTVRGMKGFSVDLRRNMEKIKEIFHVLDETGFYPGLENLKQSPEGATPGYCFDYSFGAFCHNFLSMKQWDELYWPYMKAQLDILSDKHKNCLLFMEGSSIRFADYFNEYPKGLICLRPDTDDVFEVRHKCPKIAIMGGMRTAVLGRGTKQECLTLAEKLINELGKDGGFIMSQDNLGSYRVDATRENLLAVCEFTRNYR